MHDWVIESHVRWYFKTAANLDPNFHAGNKILCTHFVRPLGYKNFPSSVLRNNFVAKGKLSQKLLTWKNLPIVLTIREKEADLVIQSNNSVIWEISLNKFTKCIWLVFGFFGILGSFLWFLVSLLGVSYRRSYGGLIPQGVWLVFKKYEVIAVTSQLRQLWTASLETVETSKEAEPVTSLVSTELYF